MEPAARILIVDDDASIRDALADYLGEHGYAVRTADGARGLERALAQGPADLLVLDLMMPGEDGLSICRRLAPAGAPILVLSALGAVTDRVVGLEVGASDYLSKPFDPRELLARVRALLRRPSARDVPAAEEEGRLRFGGWRLDLEARTLLDPGGAPLSLTAADHALLAAFVLAPGRLLSRDRLLDLTRGEEAPYDRAIDVAVSRLRRKLAARDPSPLIETVRGLGYRFTGRVERG